MNCQRFEDVVNDVAREQIIDAGARAEALRHSDGCERCAGRLEDEQAMTLSLRGLAAHTESAGAPARVEARVLAAFDQMSLIQFPALPVSAGRYRRRYLIGAIAAALLIVFGLGAIRWFAPATGNPGTPPVADAGSSGPIAAVPDQPIIQEHHPTATDSPRELSNRR